MHQKYYFSKKQIDRIEHASTFFRTVEQNEAHLRKLIGK